MLGQYAKFEVIYQREKTHYEACGRVESSRLDGTARKMMWKDEMIEMIA